MTESDFEFQSTCDPAETCTNTDLDTQTNDFHSESKKLLPRSRLSAGRLRNLAKSFAVFLVLFVCGCGIVIAAQNSTKNELEQEALELAEEMGRFFSRQLDEAILPLFSMAQFVSELDLFSTLTDKVGQIGDPGALPLLPPKETGQAPTHRNVTGVCDDNVLVHRFNDIAATIKRNSGMEGVLVNLQLAPDAVVCLSYPLINTEDFEDGVFMDNRGAIGHDLQNDPARKFIAEATIPSDKIVIAGPLSLKQCQNCDPTVETAFIARLPISMPDQSFRLDGKVYNKWGFAVAIINWNALIERSGVFESFEERGWEFQLTRTDKNYDSDLKEYTDKVVVLASTDGFDPERTRRTVSVELETTNNQWEMTVSYDENTPVWIVLAVFGSAVVALVIGSLSFVIMNQKLAHKIQIKEQNQARLDAARQSAKTERDLNDFIAHEVRNPISAALSACSFVSTSVNVSEPLRTLESKQAVRDDVVIIEQSLHFVNDLLRNMLDFHRAASNKMVLEPTPTDVKADILEPVSAMIYRRYEHYEVIVECPDNLFISVDRVRLKQIILNLARNSAKFVTKGYIRLKAELCPQGVFISVEDSGPGIPESKRDDMFRRFQDSLDSLHQGTGIGLNLCQTLMDIMGGSIYLDETYHSDLTDCPGARFVVHLNEKPMTMETVSVATTEHEGELSSSDGDSEESSKLTELPENLSVLFVDDDMILRKLFSRTVKKVAPKWAIREAANGEHPISLVRTEERFDLIFLDQYMTSAEKCLLGTETAQALRALGFDGAICGLSANDMEKPFIAAGADSFMMKPFPCKNESLRSELLRILGDHNLRSQSEQA